MDAPLSIGDYVRVTRGLRKGNRGYITGFTTSRKTADVDLDGRGSYRILVRLLMASSIPNAHPAAPATDPVAADPVNALQDDDLVFVANEHPDFPDATLGRFLDTNHQLLPSIDEICTMFAEHGFGQRSAVIACFGSRLRLAEDRVVASRNNHDHLANADFVIVDDDD